MDVPSALVGAGLALGGQSLKSLATLLDPTLKMLGEDLRDYLKPSYINFLRSFKEAEKDILERGSTIKAIEPKTAKNIIDRSRLEPDEEMHLAWGAMIANLSDPDKVYTAQVFPFILDQISKREFYVLYRANKMNMIVNDIYRDKFTEISLEKPSELVGTLNSNGELVDVKFVKDRIKITNPYKMRRTLNSRLQKLSADIPVEFQTQYLADQLALIMLWIKHFDLEFPLYYMEIKDIINQIDLSSLSKIQVANLERLGLIKDYTLQMQESRKMIVKDLPPYDANVPGPTLRSAVNNFIAIENYKLTPLGTEFIQCCTPASQAHPQNEQKG